MSDESLAVATRVRSGVALGDDPGELQYIQVLSPSSAREIIHNHITIFINERVLMSTSYQTKATFILSKAS
jgi:hypothetical protein